jgi:hypothetical protein
MIELKDILTWGGTLATLAAGWFNLKQRVAIIEALQKRDQEAFKDALERIDGKLDAIDQKLDRKMDK